MDIKTNYLIAIAIVVVIIIALIVILIMNSKKDTVLLRTEYRTIWDVVTFIKTYFVEMLSADITEDVSDAEFDKLYRRVAKIREANKKATFGMDSSKNLIKDIIANAISEELLDTEIDSILGMRPGQIPSTHCMFEAIMQNYSLRYGKSALAQWIADYKLAEPKQHNGQNRYYISIEEVYQSYIAENIQFNRKEKIKLLATLVYQLYRGFGIIDTVRSMNIDGLNIGTSGSILSNLDGSTLQKDILRPEQESVRGCWLYFKGRYIHLRFMNFGSQDEIQRIVNLLVRYNSSGTLTAKRGYMVNTMYDKSRLLAFRPPVAEYWAAFIRKFTLSSITADALLVKENVANGEIARDLLKFLMWGLVTSIITGRQGSGKTTLMSALIAYVDPVYNIRVLEMAPELYLRELYKDRNILSAQETQYVSATEIQNAFKKSDSAMSIAGEIANSTLACRFLEFSRVASIMNLATHHANKTYDLVTALANNLVDEMHTTIDAAIQQVVELLRIDVHLDYTKDGFRYIEHISEVVPLNTDPYDEFEDEMPTRDQFNSQEDYELALREFELKLKLFELKLNREYYTRQTDRQKFAVNQLMHFDLKTMSYVPDNPPSDALVAQMKRNMSDTQIKEFENYLLENYGLRDADDLVIDFTDDIETTLHTEAISDESGLTGSALPYIQHTEQELETADKLLEELSMSENYMTEGAVDMAEAIDQVRHADVHDNTEPQDIDYESTGFMNFDAIDQLVSIEAEEDAKAHSGLYAPFEDDEDFEAEVLKERAELGNTDKNFDVPENIHTNYVEPTDEDTERLTDASLTLSETTDTINNLFASFEDNEDEQLQVYQSADTFNMEGIDELEIAPEELSQEDIDLKAEVTDVFGTVSDIMNIGSIDDSLKEQSKPNKKRKKHKK